MRKEIKETIKALEVRANAINEYIVNNWELKYSVEYLAECEEVGFVKACKEYDKCINAINILKKF